MKSILLIKTFLGLVEMTSGLANASFGLPEWQAVKMISLHPAPCPKCSLADNGKIKRRHPKKFSRSLTRGSNYEQTEKFYCFWFLVFRL